MSRKPIGKYICEKCKKEISLGSKTRHDRSCDGIARSYKTEHNTSLDCEFCARSFGTTSGCAVHMIQCESNPNRIFRKRNDSWNRGLTKETSESVMMYAKKLAGNTKIGQCKDPSKEAVRREKLSLAAKASNFGGYRPNAGRSKKYSVYDSQGNRTTLQSSYEHDVFEILCELGIRWSRPKALKYGGRNYFADFYLEDYDVYLDPKNAYKALVDEEKISTVIKENDVKLFVLTKEQITKGFIGRLVEMV